MTNNILDGIISTDIYGIVDMVNNIKAQNIDEDEDTLAAGIYGNIGALEAVKILSAIQMGSELSNEVFPNRAKYDKNIMTHAVMYDIADINATPADITIMICIKEDDIINNAIDDIFRIDKACPIMIGDIEFHSYYDIVISKVAISSGIVYSARYDTSVVNNLSDISNPYLPAPTILKYAGDKYICVQCKIYQISIEEVPKKIMTSSLIDNKTFLFEYKNQLADFMVEVTEKGITTLLTPIYEGGLVPSGVTNFCYYLYVDSNTIRVKFERTSYMPGLNADIVVKIQNTLGGGGVFPYSDTAVFNTITSDKYGYSNIQTMEYICSDSMNGLDCKSSDDLRKIIPKEALSRGAITTTKDVINYFNQINTDDNMLKPNKKVDNQNERTFFTHLLLRDKEGNIVPTNTINLMLSLSDFPISDNDKYVLPAGSLIRYDTKTNYGYLVFTDADYNSMLEPYDTNGDIEDYVIYGEELTEETASTINQNSSGENYDQIVFTDVNSNTEAGNGEIANINAGDIAVNIPTYKVVGSTLQVVKVDDPNVEKMLYLVTDDEEVSIDEESSSEFYYTNPYTIVVNKNKLYTSNYMCIISEDRVLNFAYINEGSGLQFISTRIKFERKFITDKNTYKLYLKITQNVQDDMGIYAEESVYDEETGESTTVTTVNKIRVFAVLYRNGNPYRYKEANFVSFENSTMSYNYRFDFETKDIMLDYENNIRIENVGVVGQDTIDYGYFEGNTKINIYTLIESDDDSAGRYDLDQYIPGLEGYIVTNMFNIINGIDFFQNYSGIMSTKVDAISLIDNDQGYIIKSVPVMAYKYSRTGSLVDSFIEALNYKKAYIDNAIEKLENSFGIDLKFFNTYGPSRRFTLDNNNQYIDRVNIKLTFKAKLKSSSDSNTPLYIKNYVKNVIEDMNGEDSLHIPNLITEVTNKYRESLVYFEFVSIDNYGPGVQHLYHMDSDDPKIVPEFININVLIDEDGNKEQDINIEIM